MLLAIPTGCGRLILAGDIGGTNVRFGCYAAHECLGTVELQTGDYASGEDMLRAALHVLGCGTPEVCCLAVAGPVFGDVARLTNAAVGFSRQTVVEAIGAAHVVLVNDLVALGTGVAALPESRFERLGGEPGVCGAKGVVAAGTGLGMGIVVNGECLPSEGGHARVAPSGAFERELLAVTESEAEENGVVVAWEHYLSGRGMVTLYRAVSTVWGVGPESLAAHEITRRGLAGTDPICHTTLETWAGLLATASGGLAVTALALGGIYIAGGMPCAIAELLRSRLFRRRFEDAAWAADFLRRVPLYLVEDPLAGLAGAHILASRAAA